MFSKRRLNGRSLSQSKFRPDITVHDVLVHLSTRASIYTLRQKKSAKQGDPDCAAPLSGGPRRQPLKREGRQTPARQAWRPSYPISALPSRRYLGADPRQKQPQRSACCTHHHGCGDCTRSRFPSSPLISPIRRTSHHRYWLRRLRDGGIHIRLQHQPLHL